MGWVGVTRVIKAERPVQLEQWVVVGWFEEPVNQPELLAVLVSLVEHGAEATVDELSEHLTGPGRRALVGSILRRLEAEGLVEMADGVVVPTAATAAAIVGGGPKRLRWSARTVTLVSDQVIGHNVALAQFEEIPSVRLDALKDRPAPPTVSAGDLGAGGIDWAAAATVHGSPLNPFPVPDGPDGERRGREVLVDRQWGTLRLTLDGDALEACIELPSGAEEAIEVDGDVADALRSAAADALGGAGGDAVVDVEAVARLTPLEASTLVTTTRLEADVAPYGAFDLLVGPVPIRPASPAATAALVLARLRAERPAYSTTAELDRALARARASLPWAEAVDAASLADRARGDDDLALYWRLTAPLDWDLGAVTRAKDPVQGRDGSVWRSGADGELSDAIVDVVARAESTVVVCSFLLAHERLVEELERAAARGVHCYVLAAAEVRLESKGIQLDDWERARADEHGAMLERLDGVALVRTSHGFHAKCILADIDQSPTGILSTANLVDDSLRNSVEVACAVEGDEARSLVDVLRWGFWENAEREKEHGVRQLVPVRSSGLVPHPEDALTLHRIAPSDTLTDAVVAVVDAAGSTLRVSSYSWEKTHPVVEALRRAANRGVVVEVMANERHRSTPVVRRVLGVPGVEIRTHRRLHAKYVVADESSGVVCTANFTRPGPHGFELGLHLRPGTQRLSRIVEIHDRNFAEAQSPERGG
jgi:phosphatidylserine/phosphatidylglycerophosphate/cardiolipin synthase-like enzyme